MVLVAGGCEHQPLGTPAIRNPHYGSTDAAANVFTGEKTPMPFIGSSVGPLLRWVDHDESRTSVAHQRTTGNAHCPLHPLHRAVPEHFIMPPGSNQDFMVNHHYVDRVVQTLACT
jgi:hypothetical protein